ncbi:MAG: sugar kinase [Actinomyces sp.]|nr:MAG: sugar kinase [Actinomyces sp.]
MLLTVGDLYEEILVRVDAAVRPGHSESVRSARVRGGSAANVAAIDAELGGRSRFVGQVGDDAIGRTLVGDLERRGVEVAVRHAGGTGVSIVLVGGGRRTRLVDRGASARLTRIDVSLLEGVQQLYLPAVVVTEEPLAGAVEHLLAAAVDRRIPVTLGALSVDEIDAYGADSFLSLVAAVGAETVIAERAEHAALGLGPRQAVPGAGVTVVTAGPRPTLVLTADTDRSVPVRPVERIRDRTGVGDAFTAGYLASRRRGADPVSAVDQGHRVAARCLARLGPTVLEVGPAR